MHPIERLRYVARSSGADHSLLARETAGALGAFRDDPAGLVTGCRRVVQRHPTAGPLWWLCSRVLCAGDPVPEAWAAADDLDADTTARRLSHELPDDATICVLGWPEQVAEALPPRGDVEVLVVDVFGEGSGLVRALERADVEAVDVPLAGLGGAVRAADLVVLEASAAGPGTAFAVAGSLAAAATAGSLDVPVWLVAGVGRLLPRRYLDAIAGRLGRADEPWDQEVDVVPLDLIDRVIGPDGPESADQALARTDCPIAPELLKEI